MVKSLILERLPEDNYILLKYLAQFLAKVCFRFNHFFPSRYNFNILPFQVQDRSDLNKMTSFNLAVVFGPNLVWSQNQQMSLSSIGPINALTEHILSHYSEIFILQLRVSNAHLVFSDCCIFVGYLCLFIYSDIRVAL